MSYQLTKNSRHLITDKARQELAHNTSKKAFVVGYIKQQVCNRHNKNTVLVKTMSIFNQTMIQK